MKKSAQLALATLAASSGVTVVMVDPAHATKEEHAPEQRPMSQEVVSEKRVPNRLSVDRSSPYFDPIYKMMGVRFNGVERRGDVQEYNVKEGWIIVREKNAQGCFVRDAAGQFITEKLEGRVEPYFKMQERYRGQSPIGAATAISAAEAKRQRKAAKLKATGL